MWQKIKWLAAGYSRYKPQLLVLVLLTPLHAAILMTQPLVLKYVFDIIQYGEGELPSYLQRVLDALRGLELSPTGGAVALLLGFAIVILAIYLFLQGTRAWMNVRLEWEYRQRAFDATTDKGPDFFNHFRTGDLVTRMTDDVAEKLSWFACSGIFRFYEALLLVGFGLYRMLQLDATLTAYTFSPLPVLIVVFTLTSSLLDRRFDRLQKRISSLNSLMEAAFSGMRVVKAYCREQLWRRKFADAIADRRQAEIDTVKSWSAIELLYTQVWQFGVFLVVLVGGMMAVRATITIGDFVAFTSYLIMMVFPMFDIAQFLVKGRQSAVSIGRLQEIETYPAAVTNGTGSLNNEPFAQITFDDVAFRHSADGHAALYDFNLVVNRGETIALVGRVGSGKSTVLNLLTRIVDPTAGEIRIDDRPLRSLCLDDYRDMIGYVPQEPILFSETLEGNVRFGDDSLSSEQLNELLRLAQLEEHLPRFPKGVKTKIGTRGLNISGGEKQRVAIARALARKPSILILDDCTSALDARTEERLWDALEEVMPGITCFVVTHRTRTLRKADRILLLDSGRISDQGSHEELIERSELYRELYQRIELEEEVRS